MSTQTNVAPKKLSRFAAHYQGSLINGTVFDSSYKRGKPAAFPVNAVINGWQETLPLMRVGEKWQLVIPQQSAYGKRGTGAIWPNETLLFDVELLAIQRRLASTPFKLNQIAQRLYKLVSNETN